MPIPITSRRPPLKKAPDVDESVAFKQSDILTFKTLHENCPDGYQVLKEDHKITFYRIGKHEEFLIPEVTECIVVDSELHVKLFFERIPTCITTMVSQGIRLSFDKKISIRKLPNLYSKF